MSASIAIVDGGSFVLPYDYQWVKALAARGTRVAFYGSDTRYNGTFLAAMAQLPNVEVHRRAVSGTVSPRWKGVLAYIALLARLAWRSRRHDMVNLQFSVLWPLELPLWWWLRRKLVFTVHNAVPHGHAGLRHRPTQWIASLARSLLFVSEATREDFMRRYGERFRAKSQLLPHGLLPVAPQAAAAAYTSRGAPEALVFWSTVKPYKGVELFAELARSPRLAGLSLEIYGAWDRGLLALQRELAALGVKVHDGYLDDARLAQLLSRNVVFLLPYRDASQSGALYALLNHGCRFICADAGDLGGFMRRFGLDGLLLRERSAAAVADCVAYLHSHDEEVMQSLQRAQQALRWDRLMDEHAGWW
ncbi:glycosyltransferase [Piscinibacter sp. XHJ-5]|uniref:glycosyltransferase n=1 Tax=Piscinibacter sp. XHJ-5 TaxID=3037797 RepID=UPI0024536BBF|nr:glycosyltransferase [Piscinibacter sp. XHJ-5]